MVIWMGNSDGFASAFLYRGQNTKIQIDNNHFWSFAFGDEIALSDNEDFWILNCTQELWEQVKSFMANPRSWEECVAFWKEKQKDYEISDWSDDFSDLM
jgi:hypothetical protein